MSDLVEISVLQYNRHTHLVVCTALSTRLILNYSCVALHLVAKSFEY